MKTIFVTGGAGFIGTNFIYHMINKYDDYKIICIDKLTYAGNISNLKRLRNNKFFRFEKVDICDYEKMDKIFKKYKPDIVVNFAAESHVDRSIEDSTIFLKTNIMGVHTLMQLCRKYNVDRFHQVSTDEVYGDLPLDRPDLLFTEDTPLKPRNPYSSSKAAADLIVLANYHTHNIPITISRCSNNYGPFQFPEKLIPLMISNALKEKDLPVYGTGLNIRDWLYVMDHCEAIDRIIHDGKIGEVYNIGGNNEIKNIDIVKLICSKLNKDEKLIKYVEDRKGHDMRYAIDASKIKNELGWSPKVDFKEGIELTINWYLDNNVWLEEIFNGEYEKYYEKMYKRKK